MRTTGDLGGAEGWGQVKTPTADEPVFADRWESRAFALALLSMGRVSGRNLDAFRHAQQRLKRPEYFDDTYYGQWLHAAELMLVDSAILAPGAVEARARRLRGEDVEEPPVPEPNKPNYAPTGPGSLRSVDTPPRFAVGDAVRAKDMQPQGHTRLPHYLRGHRGVVDLVQPAAVLPDTHAHFLGENPQYVYTVRFDSRELWGADAEPFTLTGELYESYLEPVT
ncbi:MAG TPA: nitrile hydratase subunit beta [Pseudonocardiaceae bacterium]|jgi:nitrile hydratase beta subunit|nr:nitrile hydratase subunit beta [Pseudonocardiaceae bacterium]